MSLEALTWVINLPRNVVKGGPRDVLAQLANHAHPDGSAAWPFVNTLATRLAVSERSIYRYLGELEEMGLIRRGDQRHVDHVRANRRPVVWDLALGPVDNSPRGDRSVTPGRSRGDRSGPLGVTGAVALGVTTGVIQNRPMNRPGTPPRARAREAGRGEHSFEEEAAARALATLRVERALPLDVVELVELAREAGAGDSWAGYLEVKAASTLDLETARNPRAVLRHRLGLESEGRNTRTTSSVNQARKKARRAGGERCAVEGHEQQRAQGCPLCRADRLAAGAEPLAGPLVEAAS